MSDGVFSADSPIVRFLNRFADILILSLTFSLFCVPVFTIGAALSAASYVSIKAVSGEDGYVFKRFWSSFKKNFKQATPIWLLMLLIGFILSFDLYFWVQVNAANNIFIAKPLIIVSVVMLFAYAMILVHLFALIGNYENKTKTAVKNAFLIGLNKLPATIFIIFLCLALAYTVWHIPIVGVVFVVIGAGLLSYLIAFIHKNIFRSISTASEKARKELAEEADEPDETDEADDLDEDEPDEIDKPDEQNVAGKKDKPNDK